MNTHLARFVKIAASSMMIVAASGFMARGDEPGETTSAVQAATPSEYVLVWADEFNKDGPPDPGNWVFERGFVRNEELQWYQPENARCEGGLLIIEARRERVENPRYDPDIRSWKRNRQYAGYSSACMKTVGLHEWQYGRFEMRGRIDARPGLWPAFWSLGSARWWPACGEVDIMEYYQGKLMACACWAGRRRGSSRWDTLRKPLAEFNDPDWSSKFHVWRMDWDEQSINLYVDDALLNSVSLEETVNGTWDQANPFRETHYLLLNMAVGGTQGGDPSETTFPARFEVDYVRVSQTRAAEERGAASE